MLSGTPLFKKDLGVSGLYIRSDAWECCSFVVETGASGKPSRLRFSEFFFFVSSGYARSHVICIIEQLKWSAFIALKVTTASNNGGYVEIANQLKQTAAGRRRPSFSAKVDIP